MKEITNITPNGIHYIDDEGNPQFLDFETCYQNFLMDEQKRMGSPYIEERKEFYKKRKTVGTRYIFGSPPSIEFYTVPPTIFEFPTPENLGEVDYMIKKAGWRTRDGE
jgi:hypothetical protein